jgi:hypothetical protein
MYLQYLQVLATLYSFRKQLSVRVKHRFSSILVASQVGFHCEDTALREYCFDALKEGPDCRVSVLLTAIRQGQWQLLV